MSGIEQLTKTSSRPENVGILALEVYFPKSFVDQDQLETFDNVSKGKYTIGLGQKQMGFCCDNEDIHSLCLTVVSRLIEKHDINYKDIGRLEVGTETIIDKSKSVKTVLMRLFEESGNFDVEGVDTSNACYGGTSALLNALAWVESSSWDGRYALVVCGDIAVYAEGNARCTGGAGSVAMLIGPHAPLVVEPGLRGSCMRHSYDFYKPDLTSEYPVVDGKLSVKSYITALDSCYNLYCKKAEERLGAEGVHFSLGNIDYMIFHTPYCKLVQKSLARLALNDYIKQNTCYYSDTDRKEFSGLEDYRSVSLSESVFDRKVEKAFMASSKTIFDAKTNPSLLLAKRVGNMYTPSLYGCLASLLFSIPQQNLVDKRIGLFSYGSGLASTMFSIFIPKQRSPTSLLTNGSTNYFSLSSLISGLNDIESRLESRICVEPSIFAKSLSRREKTHRHANYKPLATSNCLFPSTLYLVNVDENFKRTYSRTPHDH